MAERIDLDALTRGFKDTLSEVDLFIARNGNREGLTATESGLLYEILTQGSGPLPGPEDRATVRSGAARFRRVRC